MFGSNHQKEPMRAPKNGRAPFGSKPKPGGGKGKGGKGKGKKGC